MAQQFTSGRFRSILDSGLRNVGGRLYTYASGTTTHKNAFTDSTLTVPCTYVADGTGHLYIALDARGEAQVWLGSGAYTMVDATSLGVTLETTDGIVTPDDAANAALNAYSASLAASSGSSLVGVIQSGTGAVARTVQDKTRDSISVKDFGAIGDSTTDDTAAFSAALATGKDIFVPFGTYKITSPLSLATAYQCLFGTGWGSQLNFALAASGAGIVTSNSSGWQWIRNISLVGVSNTSAVIRVGTAELLLSRVNIVPATAGSYGISQLDENAGAGTFVFGMRVQSCRIHGSSTTGSRGIRLGLNSQTTTLRDTVIENFETGLSVERNTDSLIIDGCTFETMMATGHAIDMRSVASTSTYKGVQIYGTHFEDVYSAICWGTTGGTGATYTSNDYHNNTFVGHAAATTYFLTVNGTCGAGCANNRVAYNDATDANGAAAVTSFFNLNDLNGAASIVDRRGNTVASGSTAWTTGSQSIYAYTVRQLNGYFGNVVTAGALASSTVTRLEMGTGTFRVPIRSGDWLPGEFLESVQVKLLSSAGAPTVNITLYKSSVDTTTSMVSSGAVAASGIVTLNVNTVAVDGFNYFLEFVCVAGGGTSYTYPGQLYVH